MRKDESPVTKAPPTTVADVMRRDMVTVVPTTSMGELVDLLRENGISGVPVVEVGRGVVGTVSISDLMWLSEWLAGEAARPAEKRVASARHLDGRRVRDVMTPDVFGVAPDASLAELANFFSRTGLGRAVVVDRGQLVGIVSVIDLLGLIVEQARGGRANHAPS